MGPARRRVVLLPSNSFISGPAKMLQRWFLTFMTGSVYIGRDGIPNPWRSSLRTILADPRNTSRAGRTGFDGPKPHKQGARPMACRRKGRGTEREAETEEQPGPGLSPPNYQPFEGTLRHKVIFSSNGGFLESTNKV